MIERAIPPPLAAVDPVNIPDLVAFWGFQSLSQGGYVAQGPCPYKLRPRPRAPNRVAEGVFGDHALEFKPGYWLECPRLQCPLLNISGKQAQVSVVAWIQWWRKPRCQFIAGMWDETNRARQYGLFINLSGRYNSAANVHAHVSANGGPTGDDSCCLTYATGRRLIALHQWHTVAMSYDGSHAKAFLNGRLDVNPNKDERWGSLNPFSYTEGLHDGGSGGADFTVGAVDSGGRMGNWFHGLLGGLAVYRRALTEPEMASLHRARSWPLAGTGQV